MSPAVAAPVDLDSDQRVLYDAITGGARTAGTQHFELVDAAGRLQGPFGLMLQVPRVGTPLQALGSALRFETELSPREREIAILTVARLTESAFERYAHNAVGAAVGLTPDELAALDEGAFISPDPQENEVAGLAARLAVQATVTSADLDSNLAHETVLEVVALVGYYRLLAQMMGLFDVGAPQHAGDEHEVEES